ncbi:6639_t:CDS:2, partial [Gigaspora margarita]
LFTANAGLEMMKSSKNNNENAINELNAFHQRQQQKQHLQGRTIINELTVVPSHLGLLTICVYCEAKKFKGESSGFCCNNGNVKLADTEAPVALQDLFVRMDEIGYDFCNNIRAYNNLFAFTSMGIRLDQRFANDTIELLKNILDEVNPFVANFCYLSTLENIANYKLIIKADHELDQRTYNAPTAS